MKKLVIICASLSRGGAERVAVYLSKYMVDRGVETTIVTADRKENEYVPFDGVVRYSLSDELKNSNKVFRLFYQSNQLRAFLKANNIDTVLIMGVPLCIFAIPGCVGTGVKVIVSERNDPKHFAGKTIVKYLSRLFMKKADGYVFQTEEAKQFYGNGLGGNTIVISNPLLLERLPNSYDGERDKCIVTAGRLNPQKNQKLLIDSFAEIEKEYPDYKLVIYGEGYLERELKEYVVSKGIKEKVFFPGNVSDLLERINSASVFVMTSDFEGMPNALIEAMAIGLPCISTDCPCGGPRELIENRKNGILVSVNNKSELVLGIKTLLDDKELANKMGSEAKKIRTILNMDNIGEKWYKFLSS